MLTASDGTPTVLDGARVRTDLDGVHQYRLAAISSDPVRPTLQALIGTSVSTGFRAAMWECVPTDRQEATLLHALLDDLPGAALVSGYAVMAAGEAPRRRSTDAAPILQVEGLCAGFQAGGTIITEMTTSGRAPLPTGPIATSLLDEEDPLAWHELRPLGPHDVRRWRMLDVIAGATPEDRVSVEVYFRDSHQAPDSEGAPGLETILHEYSVSVVVDPVTESVVESEAEAHSLPWTECIQAEASGSRLSGMALKDLRPVVREEFVGVSTCTHLNDTLRLVEDVRSLLPHLR